MKTESPLPAESLSPALSPSGSSIKVRYAGPIWTLLFLAPFIAEVLSGSTRLSYLFAFIPETMVWGCGALLCRELVRRWRAGGVSLLLLGLGLSVAEEFLIQQTSLAPLPFAGVHADYGRAFGVSWLYFLFQLGYESVWVVLIPVAVTELLFPARRSGPWLRTRGFVVNCVFFLLGAYIAGYAWIKRARPSLHAVPYQPPMVALVAGVVAILLLGWAACALRNVGRPDAENAREAVIPTPSAVSPWLAGIAAFVLAAGWDWLIGLLFTPIRFAAWIAIVGGCIWALAAFVLILRCSRFSDEMRRWSLSFGAILAIMAMGYLSTAGWLYKDLVFKIAVNLFAFSGLIWLGAKVHARTALLAV